MSLRFQRPLQQLLPVLLLAGLLGLSTSLGAVWAAAASSVQTVKYANAYLNGKPVQQVIFNLSGPASGVALNEKTGCTTVTFPGSLGRGLKSGTQKFSYPNLEKIYYEQANGKVQVFIHRRVPGSVQTRSENNRVVINIPKEYTNVLKRSEVVPGVAHTKLMQSSTRGPLLINILEVDPNSPNIEIFPALASGKMGNKDRVKNIVDQRGGIAGINASFFKQDKGIPLGTIIIGSELIAGPLFNRVALGITPDNRVELNRVGLFGHVAYGPDKTKQRIAINNINQPRVKLDQSVLYTSRWGSHAPDVPKGGYQVQMIGSRVTAISQTSPLEIPKNGYVLSGPGSPGMNELAKLNPFQKVDVHFYTLPDWSGMKHAVSGGPYLVRNGQVYVDMREQSFGSLGAHEPRSAAGVTKDGKLLLETVDGRQKHVSVGVTLHEMAQLMKSLGALHAMTLDGGSSTQMVVSGELVNTPSVSQGAAVSSCLVIRNSNVSTAYRAKN